MITLARLKEILSYNPETGEWRWLIRPANNLKVGQVAGTVRADGYRQIRIGNVVYFSGRLAWFYMTGNWPTHEVDHINRVRSDDYWTNLREATSSNNGANRSLQSNNTSGYRGVSWDKISGKWDVRVNRMHIGFYDDMEEAVIIRDSVAKQLQGPFAISNLMKGETT